MRFVETLNVFVNPILRGSVQGSWNDASYEWTATHTISGKEAEDVSRGTRMVGDGGFQLLQDEGVVPV